MPISLKYFKKANGQTKPESKWVTNVFAKWPADGLFYKVDLLSIDEAKNSCRIRYEDNLETEDLAQHLHCQLNEDELNDDEIICCVCGNGDNEPNIILCDICNQGYHLYCHEPKPEITKEQLEDENHSWICATCVYMDDCREPTKKRSRQSIDGKSKKDAQVKVDKLEPALVLVAETLTHKPSSVGKKSLNAVIDSAKMVNLLNDTDSQKKQRRTPKFVAPAS